MRPAYITLFVLFLGFIGRAQAQNCLEIENILVAACSPQGFEGQNEMVRFVVGPNPLNVSQSNMSISWATVGAPFSGWRRDAGTAAKTAQINASIQSCGYVLEAPSNWIIPANKRVLIVTSYNMIPTANSFANLTDTLYILYHNSAIITGYFKNYDASLNPSNSLRHLTITVNGCTAETVTYDALQLDHTGSSSNPGASVSFTPAGVAGYYNNGCTAPINEFSVDAGTAPAPVCPGSGTVTLNGSVTGTATYQHWSGGTGTFSTPNSHSTTYTLASGQNTPFWLYFTAKGACADTLKDSVLISIQPQNPLNITAGGPLTICNGDNLTLTATGGGSTYQWTGGPATASYTVNSPGTYTVQSSDACYNYTHSVTVTGGAAPAISINQADTAICPGTSFVVTASAAGTITWLPGAVTGNSYTVSSPGQYIAGVSNGCGTASDTLTVTALPAPAVQITTPEPAHICSGNPLTLTANGNGTLTWSNGFTGNTSTVTVAGNYTVTATNSCGSASDAITVNTDQNPNAQILNAGPVKVCPNTDVVLNGTGTGTLTWSNGVSGTTITVNQPATYTLISQTACGADTASIVVQNYDLDAVFTADPVTGYAPLNVNTNNQSTGETGNTWVFGDGTTSGEDSPAHTYENPGTYTLVLAVVNEHGCADTATVEIMVAEELVVELPNIFTPNGDQTNDLYQIKALGVSSLKGEIYNRWGVKMFSWNDPNGAWNGKSPLGAPATDGVYMCIVEAVDSLGKTHVFKTTLTLTQ